MEKQEYYKEKLLNIIKNHSDVCNNIPREKLNSKRMILFVIALDIRGEILKEIMLITTANQQS